MTTVLKHSWVAISISTAATLCVADTWTVDDDGKADFNNIQDAIDAASDGDEILVSPGTYVTKQGIRLLGKAVWLHSSTGQGSTFIQSPNGRGILCVDGETANTHIQGFTIKNCNASPYDWDGDGSVESWERSGGGMGIGNSSPTISDCTFLMNYAHSGGGGLFNYRSSPIISNCTFQGNLVGVNASGGGMYNRNSSIPQLTDCLFTANTATNGGGIYNYNGSNPSLSDCELTNNTALFYGGGMYNRFFSRPTIANTVFNSNTADKGGGGMYNSSLSDPTLTGCTFDSNTCTGSASDGGAMGNLTSSPTMTNCTFSTNTVGAEGVGGAVSFSVGCQPTISGCSFSGNGDVGIMSGGGLYFSYYCTSTISDSLISANVTGFNGGGLHVENYCELTLDGCSIVSNETGTLGSGISCVLSNTVDLINCTINQNINNQGENFEVSIHSDTLLTNNGSSGMGGMLNDAAVLKLLPESVLTSESNLQLTSPATTIIEIDNLNTTASLVVDKTLSRQGSLSVANDSGSLLGANLGDTIPLIQAGTLADEFNSIMFPVMPDGLGLQIVESTSFSGPSTMVSMEVVEIDAADFEVPVDATLPGAPVDVESLDIDNDGKDELAFLFDGSPGSVAVYSVSDDGNAPVLIQGLQVNVGNSPVDLDVADLNGDGLDDLLVANASSTNLNVLLVNDGSFTEHSFTVLTISVSSNDPSLLTCAAIIDWDGDSDLDAVVGVDVIDESTEDRYQVVLDIATNSPTSDASFDVPMYQIGNEDFADTPTCVAGAHGTNGVNVIAWGFVGGTSYGRFHRVDPARATLQEMGALDGNKVTTIEVRDLDADGGDGIVDLLASSGDAKSGYLMQGDLAKADGFGDLIPLNVGDEITDILAIDADRDGDSDFLIATPDSATSLQLLRNDTPAEARAAKLSGNTFNRQDVNTANPVTKITSGGLSPKDDEDDFTGGGNQNEGPLLNGTLGSMDQVNIIPPDPPTCTGDFNEDNVVDISDLLSLIAAWGVCESCPEDINTDGSVDVTDLLSLIAAWGDC